MGNWFDFIILKLILVKALPLFMTLDPLGNTAIIGTLIQNFDLKRQHRILRREVLVALIVMLFFYWLGSIFLAALGISGAAVEITGGIVFLMFAINLLFPSHTATSAVKEEPFIVPIAIPFIAGPSCLAVIMLDAHESTNSKIMLPALFLAWFGAAVIILLTPFLIKTLGKIGLRVLEQIMGLLCAMIAIKMFLHGIMMFLNT